MQHTTCSFVLRYSSILVLAAMSALLLRAAPVMAQTEPALPTTYLDTAYAPPTGQIINVNAGQDLQAAIDAAQPGDILELEAGATFSGNFVLPSNSGTEWIYLRSSAYGSLPAPGQRVDPADAQYMPKIVSPNTDPAIATQAGAHHFRVVGIEITTTHANTDYTAYNVIHLEAQGGQTSLSQVPTDIVFDRSYIHGTPTGNVRRGITLNSARTAVIDSYLADFHEVGADSQAIAGWNGPGPFKIVNNYLEGAGENVLIGGSDPSITDLVPSDIEIRGNHFYKPLSWWVEHSSYAGISWSVKNLLELKNARRVLIEGNILEHNWPHSQNGFSVLFTVRNQNGTAPWSVVEDVTFSNNILRHVSSGINILGHDNLQTSQQTKRILIRNNLFDDVSSANWGGEGRLFQLLDGTADVVIDHNTAFQNEDIIVAAGDAHSGFVYQNNITPHNLYGVAGDGTYGDPSLTLSTYFPDAIFTRNVLVGGDALDYPVDNFFPGTLAEVEFVDLAGGDYRLSDLSPYSLAATDGTDIGADIDAVDAATAGTISGTRTDSGSGSGSDSGSDTTAPRISSVAAGDVTSSGVTVTWDTDEASDSQVEYGTTTAYGSATGVDGTLVTAHEISLSGLASGTTYHFRVRSRDAAGNLAVSQDHTFTTTSDADTTAPAIQAVGTTDIGSSSATVDWSTDEVSDSQVEYGTTTDYGNATTLDGSLVTSHSQSLNGLASSTTYHYRVKSRDAAGNLAVSSDATFTTLAEDTSAPTVSVSEPTSGTSVSGTTTVSANASDNVVVAGVQFQLDGTDLASEDTTNEYSISWDTTAVPDGTYVLTAIARDEVGNTTTSDGVTVSVSNSDSSSDTSSQAPYGGAAFVLPGRIEAEQFDLGTEGVAYHDVTAGNQGGLYRTEEDVDIVAPYDGGYVVNNFESGEWLEYTIHVERSGTYRIEALLSSEFSTSALHVEIDGADVTGSVAVPDTGSWWTFQWIEAATVSLSAGEHVLRVHADQEYFNFDALRMSAIQTSHNGSAFAIPGEIEAERFDFGGEGVAYHDLTAGNAGGVYRTEEDVDIIAPYDGDYVVNNFETGEWLEYTIDVAQPGNYRIEALVSSEFSTSSFHVEIDGLDVTGSIAVPNTGYWGTFEWIGTGGVRLDAGIHVLRIRADREYFNLDAIRLSSEAVAWTALVNATATGSTLEKSGGCDGCEDAGAVSARTIDSGDGYVEFVVSDTSTSRIIGLSNGDTGTSRSDIDFGIQLWAGGGADVRENGAYRAETGTYAVGDVFRISVESGAVKYYRNGELFYTSGAAPTYPLLVDTTLKSTGAVLNEVSLVSGP